MARRLVTLLVVVCFGMFVFAAAGCGGDDDSSASDDTTLTETTTTEETTEDETTDEETTDEETTDTTETSASDDFATAENCEEFAQIGAQVSEAITGTADVDEIKAAFDELAAAAPDDIRPDFEVLARYMTAIAEALGGADLGAGETPDPSALAKLAQIDATEATAASTNISRWVTENCTGTTTTP
jgi:hypothetical protein